MKPMKIVLTIIGVVTALVAIGLVAGGVALDLGAHHS